MIILNSEWLDCEFGLAFEFVGGSERLTRKPAILRLLLVTMANIMNVQRLNLSASRPVATRFSASRLSRTSRRQPSVATHASNNIKMPQGVSQPPVQPSAPPALFGFVDFAEKMNSRAAMIGFFALLAVEAITGQSLLQLMGFEIGSGLGFEL